MSDFGVDPFNIDDRAAELNGGSYRNIPRKSELEPTRNARPSSKSISATVKASPSRPRSGTTSPFRQAESARANGFALELTYVATDNVETNVERIVMRSERGGHAAPPERPREIYAASLRNFPGPSRNLTGWRPSSPLSATCSIITSRSSKGSRAPRRFINGARAAATGVTSRAHPSPSPHGLARPSRTSWCSRASVSTRFRPTSSYRTPATTRSPPPVTGCSIRVSTNETGLVLGLLSSWARSIRVWTSGPSNCKTKLKCGREKGSRNSRSSQWHVTCSHGDGRASTWPRGSMPSLRVGAPSSEAAVSLRIAKRLLQRRIAGGFWPPPTSDWEQP